MEIKKRCFLILILFFLFLCVGCYEKNDYNQDKIKIYTSVYPLEDFAKKIGKDFVQVENLVPPGTEPHDFELTAKELVKLSHADIFIYNGAGLENWIEKTAKNIKGKTEVVDSSKGLPLLKHNNKIDPHIWLDPKLAMKQALQIRDVLIQVDCKHKKEYEKNYTELVKQFRKLDDEYTNMVKKIARKEFVVSHAAFYYLANRYDLKQIPVTGISPLEEPSAKELHKLIQTIKAYDVQYIFFETLVNNKLANVIRDEVGLKSLTLNPVESLTKEEIAQGADYFSIMRKNKENLAKALSKE